MPRPSCTIDWWYEGYRQVWLYRSEDLPIDTFNAFCREVAEASQRVETVDTLTTAIKAVANACCLVVRTYPGPSRFDLGDTFRVGVFKEAPPEWPPAEG